MAFNAMTKRPAGYIVPASEYNQFIDNDDLLYGRLRRYYLAIDEHKQVVNSTSESDLISVSVPANILGSNGSIISEMQYTFFNGSGSPVNFTLKFYYGATSFSIYSTFAVAAGYTYEGMLTASLTNYGATNTQTVRILGMDKGIVVTPLGTFGTASEDSTAAKTCKWTVQMGTAAADIFCRQLAAFVAVQRSTVVG